MELRSSEPTPPSAPVADPAPEMLDTPEAGGRVIRGGALRTVGYVGGVLAGAAATPLMVRHLGVVDFGRYITVTSLIFIVAGLTEAGLTTIGVREYSTRDGAERGRFLRNLVGMRTAFTTLGVALAVAFGLIAGYDRILILGTIVAGAGLLFGNLQSTYSVPLSVGLRLGWVALLDFVRQLATAVLSVALVLAGATLLPFYAVAVAAALLVLALTLVLVRGDVPLRPAADFKEWAALLRQTLPYAAATALGVVYFRIAVILMSLIADAEETGYFSASFRIIELVSGIPWLLVTSAFPILARAARDDQARLRYALQRLFEVSAIAGTWLALSIVLGAGFAIEVVGGDAFGPSATVLAILGPAMLGTFLVATWGYALLSMHRHTAILAANATALALGVTLTLVLVPPLGAVGAAIATTAVELGLAAIYAVILFRSRTDLRVGTRVVGPTVLAAAIAVGPMLVLDAHPVIEVSIATVAYFGVLALMRAIPPELTDAVRRRGARDGD